MRWHTRRDQISFFARNWRVHLNRPGGGRQFSRLLAAEVCAISGSNAGYTMFRGSVKGTGYPLHSPVSPSLPLTCVSVCHHISTGVYPLHREAGRACTFWRRKKKFVLTGIRTPDRPTRCLYTLPTELWAAFLTT